MPTRYDQDAYAWALEQATLLRGGKLDQLDTEHLAEEIESMGKGERRALVSQLARWLMHLLKWDHQPERRTRSWALTTQDAQVKVARLLNENPSLEGALSEPVTEAYEDARRAAAIETEIDLDDLPERCLYSLDEAMAFKPKAN